MAGDRPFLRPDLLTPLSSAGSRSFSPSPGPQSDFRPGLLQRSQPTPLPSGPLSPELTNLDCAFPPFPIPGKSASGPEEKTSSQGTAPSPQTRADSNSLGTNPIDSQSPENLRRAASPTSTLPPSLPNAVEPKDGTSSVISDGIHSRSTSIDSKSRYRTSFASSRHGESVSRSSTANPNRGLSVSSDRGPRNMMAEVPPLPSGPIRSFRRGSERSRTDLLVEDVQAQSQENCNRVDFRLTAESKKEDDSVDPLDMPASLSRSQTMPLIANGADNFETTRDSLFFRRSSRFSNTPQPLSIPARKQTGFNSSVKPHRSATVGVLSSASEAETSTANTLAQAATRKGKTDAGESRSVSNFSRALGLDNVYHAAGDSTSSTDSSPSETRSGSSVSSVPSDISRGSRQKPSDFSRLDKGLKDLEPNDCAPNGDSQMKSSRESGLEPPTPHAFHLWGPDSPTDPAIERGGISLLPDFSVPPPSPLRTRTPINQESIELPSRCSSAMGQKKRCRGCGDSITGKSVSSADGRLTGRYHKACFVCYKCRSPFQTADFYVLNDHPYCAHHYHELNGSLCAGCNSGIEGQYLGTVERSGQGPADCRKFHPGCLKCRTCRIVLRDDYYEWNGEAYCERDVRRAAALTPLPGRHRPTTLPSPLARPRVLPPGPLPLRAPGPTGPGPNGHLGTSRRFPERRTTKLMMI